MKDRYARKFERDEIINANLISFGSIAKLADYTDKELEKNGVLITALDGGKRLYLFDELQGILKARYFCCLADPLTRQDVLDQVPEFKVAIQFEQNSAHYNAYILNKYPEFIPLLKTYAVEILNSQDERASIETDKNDIIANTSETLIQFYQALVEMSLEQRKAFQSLFITNRTMFEDSGVYTFPAKWIPTTNHDPDEEHMYNIAKDMGYYKDYPHRNVLVGDGIDDPESACMHSWGMDVLYLLLEYHIGTNKPFTLFESTNERAYKMEQALRSRIEKNLVLSSLDPVKGQKAFEEVKKVTMTGSEVIMAKLTEKCSNYMDHLLEKLQVQKNVNYPPPNELHAKDDDLLVKKYKATYEMYSSLKNESPLLDDNDRLREFSELYHNEQRKNTIASHRDMLGIRLLNALFSILSLGIKNLITYGVTKGYYGFLNSRGTRFNDEIADILPGRPELD